MIEKLDEFDDSNSNYQDLWTYSKWYSGWDRDSKMEHDTPIITPHSFCASTVQRWYAGTFRSFPVRAGMRLKISDVKND